jgi:hypothetical protein
MPDKAVCRLTQKNPYPFNYIAGSIRLQRVWHCKCPKTCKAVEAQVQTSMPLGGLIYVSTRADSRRDCHKMFDYYRLLQVLR